MPAVQTLPRSMPDFNPWLNLWTEPRVTIRRIVAINPEHSVHVLAALGGVAAVFDAASYRGAGARLSAATLLLLALVIGPLFGLLRLYIGAALLAWTGRWLGGRGDVRLIRCALAWSQVPAVAALALWLAGLLLLGTDVFAIGDPEFEAPMTPFLLLFGLGQLAISIASLLIHLHTLAEVQGYSAWTALANVAAVMLIVVLAAALLLQLLGVPQLLSGQA